MSLFVILYVWQNIEIVKIEMEYGRFPARGARLVRDNDRLLYEIERYRRIDVVEEYARRNGLRRCFPAILKSWR